VDKATRGGATPGAGREKPRPPHFQAECHRFELNHPPHIFSDSCSGQVAPPPLRTNYWPRASLEPRASAWLYEEVSLVDRAAYAHPSARNCSPRGRKPPHKSPHAAHRCATLYAVSRALRDEDPSAPLWWAMSDEPWQRRARAAETWLRLPVTQETEDLHPRVRLRVRVLTSYCKECLLFAG